MKYLKYSVLIAASALMLGGCDKELSGDSWNPGEQSDAAGVYFSTENESFIALLDGDSSVASLKVKRIGKDGALTVPVIVKNADPDMVIPKEITFADGSDETTLDVECSSVTPIISLPLELTFPDEYINPYAAGSAEFVGSVIVSKWENVSDTGTTEFMLVNWSNLKDAGFDKIYCEMEHLLGSERYRIKNFLNMGVDFKFELRESPFKSGTYRIMPLSNYLPLADYGFGDYSYYNSWWIVTDNYDSLTDDDEESGWPVLTFTKSDGADLSIYYCQFMWYDDATKKDYCYVSNYNSGKPVAYMGIFGNLDEDMETWSGYYMVRFSWNETRE